MAKDEVKQPEQPAAPALTLEQQAEARRVAVLGAHGETVIGKRQRVIDITPEHQSQHAKLIRLTEMGDPNNEIPKVHQRMAELVQERNKLLTELRFLDSYEGTEAALRNDTEFQMLQATLRARGENHGDKCDAALADLRAALAPVLAAAQRVDEHCRQMLRRTPDLVTLLLEI